MSGSARYAEVLGADILTWNDWNLPKENRTWNKVKGVLGNEQGSPGEKEQAL